MNFMIPMIPGKGTQVHQEAILPMVMVIWGMAQGIIALTVMETGMAIQVVVLMGIIMSMVAMA